MKPKRKLKNWVKLALILLPIAVLMLQLFFVGLKLKKIQEAIENQKHTVQCNIGTYGWSCYYE